MTSRIKGEIFRQVIVPAQSKATVMQWSNAPFQCRSKIPQQRSIGIVLAVVRRQVRQFDLYLMAVAEFYQTLQELRARTGDFRTIIEFDMESLYAGMDDFPLVPPAFEAIGDEVAGFFGTTEEEPRLLDRYRPAIHLEYAERDQEGFGRHVMIEGLYRRRPACLAAPAKSADLDFRLGVDGDSQGVGVVRRAPAGFLDVVEDGVGLGNFFSGRALRTRRSR